MKVLDKENRVMVEPLSIGHFQDMEMCFPEWRLHLSEGHQHNGYGKFFFFFFFTWSQNLHPVVLKKGAPKQRFLQRKNNNIKVTGTFFFFIRSQNLHPVVLNKGAPKQRFLQRKSYRNIFLFHLKPIFESLFFKRRCPKGDVLLF